MIHFSILLSFYAGFTHAFEADHILAVSSIVTKRNDIKTALKDGIAWGLGHTSTILLMGVAMLLLRINITSQYFYYFEAAVGLMLVLIGSYRLIKFFQEKKVVIHTHTHHHPTVDSHIHLHVHTKESPHHVHPQSLAYSIGLVHGLAGSGALILLVMAQIKAPDMGIAYLLVFGLGSIVGMLLAAGLLSIPFSKKIVSSKMLQVVMIVLSGALCVLYGSWVIYKNLIIV